MKPHTVERLINANVDMQRHYPADSPEYIRAELEAAELRRYLDRMAWSYAMETDGSVTLYRAPAVSAAR